MIPIILIYYFRKFGNPTKTPTKNPTKLVGYYTNLV